MDIHKEEPLIGYQRIYQSWVQKFHSFEYFKFITKAYLRLLEGETMTHGEIVEDLFYRTKGRIVHLLNRKTNITSTISD